jgi:class 3 adenylate cyclase/tetratricopeptide (TPR) repeat protein
VTVLFADMVGFTAISERLGEEGTYALIQPVYELMAGAVREQGGSVKDFTGDGIMALFGVPAALEDGALRACRAALLINERLAGATPAIEAQHGVRPQMRIGINSGLAVVTQIGGEGANMTALGDTVNLASRLQTLAEPGAVLLSEATHRLVQGLVETSPAGTHVIKGKAESQRLFRLNVIRHGAARFDAALSRGLTAYVGRNRELETLERCLHSIDSGLQIVDVVGEPGIGKSRLLHEFRRQVADNRVRILTGSCSPDGQQTPFLVFIEVVRGAFRVSAGEAETRVSRNLEEGLKGLDLHSPLNLGLMLNLLGLKAPEGALRGLDGVLIGLRTRDLLQSLLRARCRFTPVIMLFEDLHWIDTASEEVLAKIVASDEPLTLLIIHTRRSEYSPSWAGQPRVVALPLGPLSVQETSLIVQARLGVEQLPQAVAKLVTEKAEGNALFAEEIASFLLERGAVRRTASGLEFDSAAVAATLPASVQALLTSRVDRLTSENRKLLQAAAVIGRRFDVDLLASVGSAAGEIDPGLAAMRLLDLVQPDEKSRDYIFKHALVRDALYNSLLAGPRTALHLKAAEEIERRSGNRLAEVAEVLAHHYCQTDRAERAFKYLTMAGKKSLGVYSLDEAERYFDRALELYESKPSCAETNSIVDFIAAMAQLLLAKSSFKKLKQIVRKYLPRIEALGDLPETVIVLSNYTFAALMNCEHTSAIPAAERALAMAERLGDNRSKAYARASTIMSKTMFAQLSQEEAHYHRRLLISESEHVDDAYLHSLVFFASTWDFVQRGHTDLARARALELGAYGQRLGDPRALGWCLSILGWVDIIDERYNEAFEHGEECIRVALAEYERHAGLSVKGIGQIFRGQVREGAELLYELRQQLMTAEDSYMVFGIDPPLGVAKVLEGDFSGGIRFLEELLRRNEAAKNRFGADLARLYRAETYIELLAPKQMPPFRVLLKNMPFLAITAFTGRKRAIELLLQAQQNVMFRGDSHFLARIDADLGLLYKMGKQQERAREHLQKARPIAAHLKAEALLGKIDAALAELQ